MAFPLVLVSMLPFVSAHAAIIAVDSTADTPGGVDCNLRDAIQAATFDGPVAGCAAGFGADIIDLSAIAGGTIMLSGSALQLFDDSNAVDKAVTIRGGGVTIDANSLYGVMEIRSNHVTLEKLHLVNGHKGAASIKGGCLFVDSSDVTIKGSTISNCSAEIGAGIHGENTTLTISDTTISNNTAKEFGGGLYLTNSTLSMLNSVVSGNEAGTEGGGLMTDKKLTFSNVTIDTNSAQFGGGLSVHGGQASILTSTVSNNNASVDGGGMWFVGAITTISRSTLTNNTADNEGGGIKLVSGGTVNISDSQVLQNHAVGNGGGLNLEAGEHSISNSTLSGNVSDGKGGAIFTLPSLSVSDSTLSGNTAVVQGGGIFQSAGRTHITRSRFEANTSPGSGGGIFVAAGEQTISYSTFAGNESGGNGGAIFSRSILSLSGSTLSGNTAAVRGGGLYTWKKVTDPSVITNSTFSSNYAELGGGALVVDEAVVSVYNSTITQSTSSDLNGAASVWITDGGSFKLVNSILYNPDNSQDCEINGGAGSTVGIGVNLVGLAANCDFTAGIVMTGNPMLGPLQDNGGPTLTHLPMAGSPVINVGSNEHIPDGVTRDQRGPLYLRIDGGNVELGAVEVTSALPQVIFADSLEQ